MKSFFKFCVNSDFIAKNPAVHLDTIKSNRAKTDPFTANELNAIFEALPGFTDEYGRRGTVIARETKAFVLAMRFTGMAIGDVASLEKSAVTGCSIVTNRKKTNEEVQAEVPQFVVDELHAVALPNIRYFFWSGSGKLHTRTSKWGNRLRKLFTLAGVPKAVPHMFRHTFARDFLERGGSMAELAELLGNSEAICQKHYSKWDSRRQERLKQNLQALWKDDPLTKRLSLASVGRPDETPTPESATSDAGA